MFSTLQIKPEYKRWYVFLTLFLVSAIEMHSLYAYRNNFKLCVETASGLLYGYPVWKVFQSRILTSLMVEFVSALLQVRFEDAYRIVAVGLIFLGNYACWLVVSKICAKTTHVVVSMAVYTIGFFVLRDAAWCYLWDLLSIVIMGLLMYGIIADKRPGYFVALFFVEALNHNAALIVAIFVLCRALTFERDKRRIEFDYKWLGLGLLLVLFSFAIPYTVTAALYKHELGPSIWHGPSSAGIGYLGVQFDLWLNLRKLFTPRYLSTRHVFLLILFVISVVFLRVRALSKCNWFATLVPLGVYWLSQLLFAVCVEWRIWLPFLALSTVQLAWLLNNRDVAATKLPRQRPPQSLESVSPEA